MCFPTCIPFSAYSIPFALSSLILYVHETKQDKILNIKLCYCILLVIKLTHFLMNWFDTLTTNET